MPEKPYDPSEWQPADPEAFAGLPDAFQDILKGLREGKRITAIEKELLFALQFYPERRQQEIRLSIFRTLGLTPKNPSSDQ